MGGRDRVSETGLGLVYAEVIVVVSLHVDWGFSRLWRTPRK